MHQVAVRFTPVATKSFGTCAVDEAPLCTASVATRHPRNAAKVAFSRNVVRGNNLQYRSTRSDPQNCVRRPICTTYASAAPATVADTKKAFLDAYPKPIPAIFNTILQELLVLHHLIRYNKNYEYNSVMALGFTSVFDQIFEAYDYGSADDIFRAYINALAESPEQYRADASSLAEVFSSTASADELIELDSVKALASMAGEGKLMYNKFIAIGLFRLLELAGVTEPAALEKLAKGAGVKLEDVNRDLMVYKGVLSKLTAAKDLQKEFLERERKKAAERMEAKAEKDSEAVPAAIPETAET